MCIIKTSIMKQIFLITSLFLFLYSCKISNHSHDGQYKSNVFNDATMSWIHTEIIELDGNTLSVKSISIIDGSILSEFKTDCTQYDDRVEFKNKNGVVQVARFDVNGNLKYGEYVYRKIKDEDTSTELTFTNANTTQQIATKYNNDKVKGKTVNTVAIRKTPSGEVIKTYSDDQVSYDYVQNVIPNSSEFFFQGTKNFDGHIDDNYVVSIHGNRIIIKDPTNADSILLDGTTKEGRILNKQRVESKFRFKKSTLYYHGETNEWYVFEPSMD
jgi:hypothetical protein